MLKELKELQNPNFKSEKWIQYLYFTQEKNYNLERLNSVKDLNNKLVYQYVIKNFEILNSIKNLDEEVLYYVVETLKWCEVGKVGSKSDRKLWQKKGFSLFAHNISSSQIYVLDNPNYNEIVRVLIKTHGLIGQYLRGEANLDLNYELYELIDLNLIKKELLKEILIVLNRCIIEAVDEKLYLSLKNKILDSINLIISNKFEENEGAFNRLKRLNKEKSNAEIEEIKKLLSVKNIAKRLELLFSSTEFWYYESALHDFSIIEQIKILLMASNYLDFQIKHITFEKVMKTFYLDYDNKKMINIYKKRIIEEYLSHIEFDDILKSNIKASPHIEIIFLKRQEFLIISFKFSIQAQKLIEFCEVASTSNSLYKKAVYLLYDLFGFRRDTYDRFYNEFTYLNTMNESMIHKAKILDFITGKNILDVGPGGGALMDLILDKDSSYNVYGIDISTNVIDTLTKRKLQENKKWNLIKGDALYLENYFKKGTIDTIIYSSIIHELYSYIELDGKKFNINTVLKALKSAYNILPVKGRIIIRDGIKTEPEDSYRIIEFKESGDLEILNRYCNDFKGRNISYKKIGFNRVKMLVNDAMEFLYTYTWGEDSYPLEVKEQFGYLTPTQYIDLITTSLPNSRIIFKSFFLQEGYEENLLNKISIYDEQENIVKLPNSTGIIVIEKDK